MIIKNIKILASQQAESDIKDCVFSIPPNWGWKAKMALINAANIADLSVLGLVN
jgi:molecular chaperone DnaK (HSP70)